MEFQLTRSRGAWRLSHTVPHVPHKISTHTLTWSVTSVVYFGYWAGINFNSHAHVERDIFHVHLLRLHNHFNSHAHVERDVNIRGTNGSGKFQLTRSRGAWLPTIFYFTIRLQISTHTLTWSVTKALVLRYCHKPISTHTLTWSVTRAIRIPRPLWPISTHTLTWSVTWRILGGDNVIGDFNSHAHVERDSRDLVNELNTADFNSHAHVERDHSSRSLSA